jgi:hypothetical protein
MPTARGTLLLLLLLLGPAGVRVEAVEQLVLGIDSVEGADWRAAGIEIGMDLAGAAIAGSIGVRSIELPDAALAFADTRIRCGRIETGPAELACRDAAFTFTLPDSAPQTAPGGLVYTRADATLRFELRDVALAGGRADLHGIASSESLRITASGTNLDLAALAPLAERFAPGIAAWNPAGIADVEAAVAARGGTLAEVSVRGTFRDAAFSNEAGTAVAEGAAAVVEIRAARSPGGWELAADVAANGGEAYVEPVYADLSAAPLRLSARGTASDDFGRVALDALSFEQGELLAVTGELEVSLPSGANEPPLCSGVLRLEDASAQALYSNLLQVLAAGTMLGDLETAGELSGSVRIADNAIAAVDLRFQDVYADDGEGRLSIAGLTGDLHWPGPAGEPGDAPVTTLSWNAASVYRVPLAAATLRVRLGGDDLELVEPVRVPTMGGALRIERLAVRNFEAADASGVLDAALEPIQLGQLTAAFGWPTFSGTLSGTLPLLRYDGGVMTLGGALTARAFDGDIEIANLRLEEPFGLVPRLSGDIRLRNLDLELVTNTFSFGLIQGRLSGDVTGLELAAWEPVAMDLHLYTPPGDRSRKRISQRAVENLASVGGGGGAVAAALSSGFLKFFEAFAYETIELRCILANGTCAMSGAGPAGREGPGGGYYIVKGKGLPRIDVVGYQSQVSWSQLVAQLQSILETGTPVVL